MLHLQSLGKESWDKECLLFGIRQTGSEEDGKLAGDRDIQSARQSDFQKDRKTRLYLKSQSRMRVACLNFGNYRKVLDCETP